MSDLQDRRGFNTDYYEPAEDSHLLATASLDRIDPDDVVLDVGTGSGFVAECIHESVDADVIGIDVNPHACRQAAERGIPVVRGDVVAPFQTNSFDVVVCNPPYLPTSDEEQREDWLGIAVSGGRTGRSFVDRLFADVGRVLRPEGRVLMLASSLMDVEAVHTTAAEYGFVGEELDRDASFPFEVLSVLEYRR